MWHIKQAERISIYLLSWNSQKRLERSSTNSFRHIKGCCKEAENFFHTFLMYEVDRTGSSGIK